MKNFWEETKERLIVIALFCGGMLASYFIFPFYFPVAEAQQAGKPPTTMNEEIRTLPDYVVVAVPSLAANITDIEPGVNGVIAVLRPTPVDGGHVVVDGGFTNTDGGFSDSGLDATVGTPVDGGHVAVDGGFTDTDGGHLSTFNSDAGFRPPPYACKVNIVLKDNPDAGSSAVLACTGAIRLTGRNQWGFDNYEDRTTDIEESGASTFKSSRVYEELKSISVAGCSNIEYNDVLQVSCSTEIGLRYKITNAAGIRSVCIGDLVETSNADTVQPYCYTGAQVAFDSDDWAVNVAPTSITGAPDSGLSALTSGDRVTIRLRTPDGR